MSFIRQLFSSRRFPYIPGYNQREDITINFSGSILTLQLPYHTPFDELDKDRKPPAVVNLYQNDGYRNLDDGCPEWQRRGESGLPILGGRDLAFLAPPWHESDRYAYISFGMGVGRMEIMPQEMSLFNPQHLEQSVMRSIYFGLGGPAEPNYRHRWGPINWRVQQTPAGTWIYYERHPPLRDDKTEEATNIGTSITLPLGHRYCLSLGISCSGYTPVEWFFKYFNAVKDSVLNSLHLELSERAQAELEEARQRWPNAKASEHRDPECWQYPKWRRGDSQKGEPDIVILKPGSPPPPFTP